MSGAKSLLVGFALRAREQLDGTLWCAATVSGFSIMICRLLFILPLQKLIFFSNLQKEVQPNFGMSLISSSQRARLCRWRDALQPYRTSGQLVESKRRLDCELIHSGCRSALGLDHSQSQVCPARSQRHLFMVVVETLHTSAVQSRRP